jgi:hypothetical protein
MTRYDRHDSGVGAGTDCGGVFFEGDVAGVVVGLDVPVAADDVGEVGGWGLGGVRLVIPRMAAAVMVASGECR